MEYKLIAHNKDAVNDDPVWNECITNGMADFSRLELYEKETFFDMVAYAEKGTFLPGDRLKYGRVLGKLLRAYSESLSHPSFPQILPSFAFVVLAGRQPGGVLRTQNPAKLCWKAWARKDLE